MMKAIVFDTVGDYKKWLREKGQTIAIVSVVSFSEQILVTYQTSDGGKS